jgi:hypothetical protein
MKRLLPIALTATLTLALAGCGSDSKHVEPVLPSCAKAGPPVELPAAIPDSFPFPDGTRITSVLTQPDYVVVDGFVPQRLKTAAAFFRREVPRAGFELSETEIEEDEADSLYSGHGVSRGSWRVFEIPACPEAVNLTVSAGTD